MFNVKNKKVLFITTKNLDYLRNVQELNLLKQDADSVDIIGSIEKSYIKRLIKIYSKILFGSFKSYDSIFIGFAPQLILPMFSWKFKNKEIIMDFFISVYDTMIFDRKKFKENSIIAKLCKWLDKKCIHKANYIISDTNAHGEYFSSEFDVHRNKISTLYLEADTSIYKKDIAAKPERLKNKFVVLYFGSILPLQGIEVILDAVDILKEQKDIYFYIIGPIGNTQNIVKSDTVEYINWLPQDKLAEHISYSDLCLAGHFNKDINKAKRTIPGKAYIYEAMDKPMILGDNPATHELYKEDDKHFFVEMGNANKLAEKIVEIKEREIV